MEENTPKTTILAIDDDPLILKLIEASLVKDNYNIIFAQNGEMGLRLAEESKPDLILLDVVMPGIDGFEFCAIARKNPALKNIPIIIITALDDRDSKVQGLEAGADDYICKPFDKIEFRARIKTITRLTHGYLEEINRLKEVVNEKEKKIAELNEKLRQIKV
jgi:DNA-binding response OmpR family regulator